MVPRRSKTSTIKIIKSLFGFPGIGGATGGLVGEGVRAGVVAAGIPSISM